MTTAHTATPWTVEQMPSGRITITSGQFFVAGDDNGHGIHQDNAQFIVRACNAHDDLVRELTSLLAFAHAMHLTEAHQNADIVDYETFPEARAALAKAGAA